MMTWTGFLTLAEYAKRQMEHRRASPVPLRIASASTLLLELEPLKRSNSATEKCGVPNATAIKESPARAPFKRCRTVCKSAIDTGTARSGVRPCKAASNVAASGVKPIYCFVHESTCGCYWPWRRHSPASCSSPVAMPSSRRQ